MSENINIPYNKIKTEIRGELMGKPVDYNLFPGYQKTHNSRLDELKEEFIEEQEKAKIDGHILEFEKTSSEELSQ